MCHKKAARHLMNQWLIGGQEANLEIDYLLMGANRR